MKSLVTACALALAILLPEAAWGHDMKRADLDGWYESLRVPRDGLVLSKGASCCDKRDCKQRIVRRIAPGLYETLTDDGKPLRFTERPRIDDPKVRMTNPYLRATVCIYAGAVVCWVPARTGV